jgi:hypothetical protein
MGNLFGSGLGQRAIIVSGLQATRFTGLVLAAYLSLGCSSGQVFTEQRPMPQPFKVAPIHSALNETLGFAPGLEPQVQPIALPSGIYAPAQRWVF